jgi:heat shock protein HslJ
VRSGRVRAGLRLVATAGACVLLLAACMTSHDVITDRPWKLVLIGNAAPAAEAGISFGTDGRFTMQPGCNNGGGTYTISGNRIDVQSLEATAMACGDPADAQEQVFVAALEADPRFEIETGTGRLRLATDDTVLVFDAP